MSIVGGAPRPVLDIQPYQHCIRVCVEGNNRINYIDWSILRMKRLHNGEVLSALKTRCRNGLKVAMDCSLQEHMSDKVRLVSNRYLRRPSLTYKHSRK